MGQLIRFPRKRTTAYAKSSRPRIKPFDFAAILRHVLNEPDVMLSDNGKAEAQQETQCNSEPPHKSNLNLISVFLKQSWLFPVSFFCFGYKHKKA